MNVHRILFPTDFSDYNDGALRLASSLAAQAQARLYIIHVHEWQPLNVGLGEAAFLDAPTWREELQEVEEQLHKVVPSIGGVDFVHECLTGSPESEILDFAEAHDVDLIVMASHGRTGLSRLLMGSIAEGVMRRAKCPVLIVKQPVREFNPQNDVESHATKV
jgi:nucleotide-binding universal stress UspA family protein